MREVKGLCPLRFREFSTDEEMQECIGERCMWHARCFDNGGNDNEPTNGTTSETNGITRGTNGDGLSECPHCGSVAEYVSEHAKGKRWAVACTMTSKVAADEGRPMCRCRTPFFRDKGQARDVWNRRTAVTEDDFVMAVHDGELWGKCSECERVKNAEMQAAVQWGEAAYANDALRQRDELIRDMARELRGLNDGGISTDCMEYERRMRELGIEVNDDEI